MDANPRTVRRWHSGWRAGARRAFCPGPLRAICRGFPRSKGPAGAGPYEGGRGGGLRGLALERPAHRRTHWAALWPALQRPLRAGGAALAGLHPPELSSAMACETLPAETLNSAISSRISATRRADTPWITIAYNAPTRALSDRGSAKRSERKTATARHGNRKLQTPQRHGHRPGPRAIAVPLRSALRL